MLGLITHDTFFCNFLYNMTTNEAKEEIKDRQKNRCYVLVKLYAPGLQIVTRRTQPCMTGNNDGFRIRFACIAQNKGATLGLLRRCQPVNGRYPVVVVVYPHFDI